MHCQWHHIEHIFQNAKIKSEIKTFFLSLKLSEMTSYTPPWWFEEPQGRLPRNSSPLSATHLGNETTKRHLLERHHPWHVRKCRLDGVGLLGLDGCIPCLWSLRRWWCHPQLHCPGPCWCRPRSLQLDGPQLIQWFAKVSGYNATISIGTWHANHKSQNDANFKCCCVGKN